MLLCPWGFSRQEYWSGLPRPPPGDLSDPGIEPRASTFQAYSLLFEPPGKPLYTSGHPKIKAAHKISGLSFVLIESCISLKGYHVESDEITQLVAEAVQELDKESPPLEAQA